MTIFYFTSTGNSLAVAKKIGGNLVSIPQVIDNPNLSFKDDVIGMVFPVYAFGMPKMVRKFCETAKLNAEYMFIIGTYGGTVGAAMFNAQKLAKKHGYKFNYAESIKMADNFLPGHDLNEQIDKLPLKKIEDDIERIVAEICNRKNRLQSASLVWRGVVSI